MEEETSRIIPLMELVFQEYRHLEVSLESYEKLDRKMLRLERNIQVNHSIFEEGKRVLHTFVGLSFGGRNYWRAIISFIASGTWVQGQLLLENVLKVKLDTHYEKVRATIKDVYRTLQDINKIVEELPMNNIIEGEELENSALEVQRSRVTSVLKFLARCYWNTIARLAAEDPDAPVQMKRLTLKGTGKEPILKELQAKLDIQNFDFALSVHLAQELTQRDKKPSSASTSATTSATTSELRPDVNVTDPDLRLNQIMHRCLYRSLYKPSGCGQHSIHLCLCEEDATHQSRSPTTVYSFFVSIGLNPSGAPVTENPQRLRISRSESGATESPSHAATRCCSNILSSARMSTHCLSDNGPPTFQFIVHSDTPTPTSDTIENSILTLHHLTKLCPQGKRCFSLEEKDQYLLAVKLARWVFLYHNTPWPVPKLDTHHIHFFTQYETSLTPADWSPYIYLSSPEGLSGPVEDVNCSNALGWMLVELGLGKSRDDIPGNTRRAINEASRSLMIRLGRRYSSFVKELLEFSGEGGKSGDSEAEKQRIKSLQITVECIEKKGLEYFSG